MEVDTVPEMPKFDDVKMDVDNGVIRDVMTKLLDKIDENEELKNANAGVDPILIDLVEIDDDDEMDLSKENIEKIPSRTILNNLTKEIPGRQTEEMIAKIRVAIGKLTREALEDMYCKKIREVVEAIKRIRHQEGKILRLNISKDKLVQRTQDVEKQMVEMAKSMKAVTENMARNRNYSQQQIVPLKFFRTVGVQVRSQKIPKLPKRRLPLGISKMNGNQRILPPLDPAKPPQMKQITTPPNITLRPNTPQQNAQSRPVSPAQFKTPPPPSPRNGYTQVRIGPGSITRMQGSKVVVNANQQTSPNDHIKTPIKQPTPPPNVTVRPIFTQTQQNRMVNPGQTRTPTPNPLNRNGYLPLRVGPASVARFASRPNFNAEKQNSTPLFDTNLLKKPLKRLSTPLNVTMRPNMPHQNLINRSASPGPLSTKISPQPTGPGPLSRISRPGQMVPRLPNSNPTAATGFPKFVVPDLPLSSAQPNKPKAPPPRPSLTLQEQDGSIILSWTSATDQKIFAEIQTYQIYTCNESLVGNPMEKPPQWKRVGDVKALALPMACTLSQFTEENRYYFIVRGVDVYNRTGQFCETKSIVLLKKQKK